MTNPIDLVNNFIIKDEFIKDVRNKYSKNRYYHEIEHLSYMYGSNHDQSTYKLQ